MTLDDLTPERAERWQRQLDRDIRLHYQEHFDLTPYFEAMLGLGFWLAWQERMSVKPIQVDFDLSNYFNSEEEAKEQYQRYKDSVEECLVLRMEAIVMLKTQYESYKDSVAAWLVTGFVIPPKPDPELLRQCLGYGFG